MELEILSTSKIQNLVLISRSPLRWQLVFLDMLRKGKLFSFNYPIVFLFKIAFMEMEMELEILNTSKIQNLLIPWWKIGGNSMC